MSDDLLARNRVELGAVLLERQALRLTPAGVPVIECVLAHRSEQVEAGGSRQVECEVRAIAVGDLARWLGGTRPGSEVRVQGFLAARSRNRKQPLLHLTALEFIEGNQNAKVFQEEG